MKKHFLPALKLSLVTILFFSVIYPLVVLGIAQFAPNKGGAEIIVRKGKKYYSNIGQSFTADKYFWSRPSAVAYNAAGSGGSNKSASNTEYLNTVQARIDTFLVHNPEISKSQIPVDLVTASGSGLDPNSSVQAARVQVKRIAKIRNLSESSLNNLIDSQIEKPFLGLFGPEKINVLKLNLALDELK